MSKKFLGMSEGGLCLMSRIMGTTTNLSVRVFFIHNCLSLLVMYVGKFLRWHGVEVFKLFLNEVVYSECKCNFNTCHDHSKKMSI